MLPLLYKRPDLRCTAKAKHTGNQCCNIKAYSSSVCRFHGARKKGSVPTGAAHPRYKNGLRTKGADAERNKNNAVLRNIEQALIVTGAMESRHRTKAKLPAGCSSIKTIQQVENLIFTLDTK